MKCEKCNTEHSGNYGSGRFCSKECSHSFSAHKAKGKTRDAICPICGKKFLADIRAFQGCKCPECGKKRIRKCRICGQTPCEKNEVCKSPHILSALIKYIGFDQSTIGSKRAYEEFARVKNILIEDYWDKKLSTVEMAEKYHHQTSYNFGKIIRSLGIETRSLSESARQAIQNGRMISPEIKNQYKSGYHITWNSKKVFLRSSYEFDYAKELDNKKIDYSVEKLRILYWDSQLNRQRVAIPDFYITNDNMIVEIKSIWTYNEQNLKDRIKSYKEHGYKFKLILDHKEVEI